MRLATRYGSNAMESLINDVLKLGGLRERLEIKIFGGGRVLAPMTDIGARNIEFVRNYLSTEGLRTNAQDVGGEQPRKVIYYPTEGRVRVRKLRPIENRGVSDREQLYLDSIEARKNDGGDIELFYMSAAAASASRCWWWTTRRSSAASCRTCSAQRSGDRGRRHRRATRTSRARRSSASTPTC